MFENNNFYDYPTQVKYQYIGEIEQYDGIAYGEVIINIANGEVIYIGSDEVNIVSINEDWLPLFID